ncbi:MAG: LamG-like jellyroll fold domain-containing protein, partial [Litorivicinus sp.]
TGGWTAMVWRDTGAGFAHYAETSGNNYYASGVASTAQDWFSVDAASGQLTLENNSGGTVSFDDLVVLPFVAPASMIAAFAAAAAAFGPLPELRWSGDFADDQVIEGVCRNVKWSSTEGALPGGTASDDLRKLQFDILEQGEERSVFQSTRAIQFDGVDESAIVNNFTLLDGATAFTLAMRLRIDTWGAYDRCFSLFDDDDGEHIFTIDTESVGNLTIRCGPTQTAAINNQIITIGANHSLILTYSAGTLLAYVDGASVTVSGAALPASIATGGTPTLQFGANDSSFYAAVTENEVAIWLSVANAGQVAEIHNSGVSPDFSNLASIAAPDRWWRPTVSEHPTLVDVIAGDNATMTNMEAADLITTNLP